MFQYFILYLLWPSANPFPISVSYGLYGSFFLLLHFIFCLLNGISRSGELLITDFQEMKIIEEQNVVDEQMFNNYIVAERYGPISTHICTCCLYILCILVR